jgi:hypothetical protein
MTIRGWARGGGCAVLVALASGCGTSAKLRLRDGSVIKGKILRSDAERVWVDAIWVNGAVVDRRVIADVRHPGTDEMTTGAFLLGFAGAFTVLGLASSDSCGGIGCVSPRAMAFVLAVPLGVTGLCIETYGLLTSAASRSRYAAPENAPRPGPPQWWQAPPTQGAKGIKLGFEF